MNLTLLEPVRPLAIRVPPNKTNPTPFNSASNAGHVITSSYKDKGTNKTSVSVTMTTE